MRENFDYYRRCAKRAGRAAMIAVAVAVCGPALAQDRGTLHQVMLPPLAQPADPSTPAKDLSARKLTPAPMQARSIGSYVRGCLAGAVALPINGRTWQVMRLSRNRNWGHPELIRFLERLADKVPKVAGWPGLLVGDIAQPRGAPMLTGHTSHQIGLDADIWLTPMPDHELTRQEREEMSATDVVAADKLDVDPGKWTPGHGAVIKAASQDPEVDRIFVNAAIKKALCREAGHDRAWLAKVRPWWGHNYHFHVRMACPEGSPDCHGQPPVPAGDGCGADLAYWFKDSVLHPKPSPPSPPKPPIKVSDLPPACRQVLMAP
jgi:penicillin-insensitive murein endopeptidase